MINGPRSWSWIKLGRSMLVLTHDDRKSRMSSIKLVEKSEHNCLPTYIKQNAKSNRYHLPKLVNLSKSAGLLNVGRTSDH